MTESTTEYDVTVALLTHNAGPVLGRVLQAVASQETALQVEIVAVDSGSTDGSAERLREAGARVVSIAPEDFDFGRTRDLAFEEARGGVVVSLSQDAIPAHTHWLEHLVEPLADARYGASCGRSIPDPERGVPQFAWERNGHFYFTREIRKFVQRYGRGLSNANSAIRRTVWERLRFGEQSIGEDFRFQTKMHAEGLEIAFPAKAAVLHHHDYTFGSLFKRCRNEGMGLRELGCTYTEADLFYDLVSPGKYIVWLRDLLKGRLTNTAALAFPWVRPVAVYAGSRFGRTYAR